MRNFLNAAIIGFMLFGNSIHAALPTTIDTRLFVAPDGNDSWSGQIETPKSDRTDGPLATLAGARNAVRKLKAANANPKPIGV